MLHHYQLSATISFFQVPRNADLLCSFNHLSIKYEDADQTLAGDGRLQNRKY